VGKKVDEIPDEIGERLRYAREKAGLAVEDVVFQTRLPRSAVVALEGENFAHFTSPVYAKSFLAQYSDFLNVDASLWLDALQPASYIEGGALLPLFEKPITPPSELHHHHQQYTETQGPGWLSALWFLVLSAALVFAVMKAYQFYEARFGWEDPPSREAAEKPPIQNQSAAAKPPPAPKAVAPAAEPQAVPVLDEEDSSRRPPRAIIVR
jgi:cytoskeletal protein RodZ